MDYTNSSVTIPLISAEVDVKRILLYCIAEYLALVTAGEITTL
jgi:hypothetical protein